ncbi:hypothetical protein E4T38_06485 [Aureobasidium subglaciale]|nr:hypothetical protein E4T38_06485 [Aureobasidium subglaciale]KAI5219359.1 hypothetical protein E4T40_06507 [Aureobasidium subglaciale]KAI5223022.1 hypothetical protein E4T41_06347 [Aureobasidium subglaciale]KAI5260318.1 hypothetical protein E4T46_06137 [Aureobasidium subglaciale]
MSAPQQGNPAAGKEDYLDKGMDALEKKQGQDPNKLRSVNEKVSDTARGMFEKATGMLLHLHLTFDRKERKKDTNTTNTGKKVPDKVSN